MIPTIIELGPIPIHSFGLMIALMFVACVYRLGDCFASKGIDRKLAETFVFWTVLSGLAGARLWYMIEYWSDIKSDVFGALLSGAGFTFYGGFVVGIATVLILCKKNKIPLHTFFDLVGPTLALGYAIGRLGCQLSGDGDYGITTTSFWGMSYATGVVPTPPGVLVLPTPLFESIAALIICHTLLAVRASGKFSAPFQQWGLYLVLISAERFFIEFIRIKEKYGGLSEAHYFSILFAICGVVLLIRSKNGLFSFRN